jgi:hypothetical protein
LRSDGYATPLKKALTVSNTSLTRLDFSGNSLYGLTASKIEIEMERERERERGEKRVHRLAMTTLFLFLSLPRSPMFPLSSSTLNTFSLV